MEIKRGYVKWQDEDGLHKEPLHWYPDLLAKASDKEKAHAENVRELLLDKENILEEDIIEDEEELEENIREF